MLQIQYENFENYGVLRDALSSTIIERVSRPQKRVKSKKKARSSSNNNRTGKPAGAQIEEGVHINKSGAAATETDAEELAEFIDYIASLTFASLPRAAQTVTHRTWAGDAALQEKLALPLTSTDVSDHILPSMDPAVSESLVTYGIITPPAEDMTTFLAPVLTSYLTAVTAPPPAAGTTRGKVTDCEICGRDWVPLTYHHLIPRMVHAKAVKRGWHREEDLQNVAWLCRACHSFVHSFAGHEELARDFYTVEKLLEQEQVQSFAKWVGRVRFGAR